MSVRARLFIMMVLQIGSWGAWVPKLHSYMIASGFGAQQLALVGSCFGIAAILGMFFSNQLADRYIAAERVLAGSHLACALCLVGVAHAQGFGSFFAFFLAYCILFVPTISLSNTIALANLPNPARDFGPVRMGGTLGFVMASWPFIFLLGSASDVEEMRWIFLVAALLSLLLAGFALTLPHTPPQRSGAIDSQAWRKALRMLRTPFIGVLFAVTLIDSVIHNGYYVVADMFLTNRVGIASNLSMVVLSVGQVAEVAAMLSLGWVLAKLGWRTTMMLGVLGHAVRYFTFAFVPDSVPVIIAVQLMHGVCYAFFFATLYIFIDEVCPKDIRVSMQGLFNILILGVGTVIASFVFPRLMFMLSYAVDTPRGVQRVVDYSTLFLVPATLSLIGVALLALLFKPPLVRPRQALSDEAPVVDLDARAAAPVEYTAEAGEGR